MGSLTSSGHSASNVRAMYCLPPHLECAGRVMQGVELGEIGPKLNSTSNNIGYCRFKHVRVPNSFIKAVKNRRPIFSTYGV